MTCPGGVSCVSLEAWLNMAYYFLPAFGIAGFLLFHRMTDREYTKNAEKYFNEKKLNSV